jgi:hypothetical protein
LGVGEGFGVPHTGGLYGMGLGADGVSGLESVKNSCHWVGRGWARMNADRKNALE